MHPLLFLSKPCPVRLLRNTLLTIGRGCIVILYQLRKIAQTTRCGIIPRYPFTKYTDIIHHIRPVFQLLLLICYLVP